MSPERWAELLNGPLAHPFVIFRLQRLALALQAVVVATGDAGERALESYCADLDARDRAADAVPETLQ